MSPQTNIENLTIAGEAQPAIDWSSWGENLELSRPSDENSFFTICPHQRSEIKSYDYRDSEVAGWQTIGFPTSDEDFPSNTPLIQGLRPSSIAENPFSKIDELLDNEEKFYSLTNHIRISLIASYGERLATRIENLFEVSIEEEPDGIGISAESLHYFLSFLQSAPKLDYPDVVLSPPGNIVAEWHVDSKHHFSADFLPDGDTRFVIFRPNLKNSKKTERFSGISTFDCLYDIMKDNRVLKWASSEH